MAGAAVSGSPSLRCPQCGRPPIRAKARFCGYCGAQVPGTHREGGSGPGCEVSTSVTAARPASTVGAPSPPARVSLRDQLHAAAMELGAPNGHGQELAAAMESVVRRSGSTVLGFSSASLGMQGGLLAITHRQLFFGIATTGEVVGESLNSADHTEICRLMGSSWSLATGHGSCSPISVPPEAHQLAISGVSSRTRSGSCQRATAFPLIVPERLKPGPRQPGDARLVTLSWAPTGLGSANTAAPTKPAVPGSNKVRSALAKQALVFRRHDHGQVLSTRHRLNSIQSRWGPPSLVLCRCWRCH